MMIDLSALTLTSLVGLNHLTAFTRSLCSFRVNIILGESDYSKIQIKLADEYAIIPVLGSKSKDLNTVFRLVAIL